MLNRSGESRCHCLVPHLREKHLGFASKCGVSCGFSIAVLYQIDDSAIFKSSALPCESCLFDMSVILLWELSCQHLPVTTWVTMKV